MPLIMHAAWLRLDGSTSEGHLFVWAENLDFSAPGSSDDGQTTAVIATSTRQRAPKIPSHPSQAAIGHLRSLLAAEISSVAAHEMQPASATVWLPSQNGDPLSRAGLFRRTPPRNGNGAGASNTPELHAWQITGLGLSPLPALSFLTHLNNELGEDRSGSSMRRVRLGNDLLFWSHAAKHSLEILVSQQYLPGLRARDAGQVEAIWQPSLVDSTVEAGFERLVQAMPPVCRAYNLATPLDAPAPATLVEHFVMTVVDAAVRSWSSSVTRPEPSSAARQWLGSLLSPSRLVQLPPQPAHQILREWHGWTEQLYVTNDANFRICFRLEEPDLAETGVRQSADLIWKLHYFLQARDNPGLLIPASQVWRAPNNTLRFGNRRVDQPQERLLAGLGAASRLFEPIRRSLASPQPELTLLSTAEAYRFLSEIGPLLESSGFGLILPDGWITNRRARLGLRLNLAADETELWDASSVARERGQHPLGLRGLVNFSWELTLGGGKLEQSEFDQLAAMRSPLVRIRDRWVELDPVQVSAAKQFLARTAGPSSMTLLQAIRISQSFVDADSATQSTARFETTDVDDRPLADRLATAARVPSALPLDTVHVEGWLSQALAMLQNRAPLEPITEPHGFVGELRPYQRRGVGWLDYLRKLGLGACLADDMGLGKTVQAIALLLHIRSQHAASDPDANQLPGLLICPTSVVANWRHEIDRFAPGLSALVHHGSGRLSGDDFHAAIPRHHLVITSFGTARRDIALLSQHRWSDLILDEAQNIKNPNAKQTQAVRQLDAQNRIALTGTPVENRLFELWSIMEFLNPGYLDRQESFRQRYIVPIERYNDDTRAAELRRVVQPFLLRRLKSDPTIISDLPEKNEMVVYCALTPEQATLYEATVQSSLAALGRSDGIQRRGLVLSLLTKLKQITNHPAHYLKQDGPLAGRSGKLNRVTEMLEEALSIGDQALVFTQFVEMGYLLQRHLREKLGTEVLFLHGGTPAKQRDKMVQLFQSENGPCIFVLSLRAGGFGLNLTRANHVFHFDRWWNPAVENQATDRAFRIGQTRNVQVHKFVVAGTLEERIHALLESKQALAESIVGSGEDWLTELDTEQLRELLTLRRDMLEED